MPLGQHYAAAGQQLHIGAAKHGGVVGLQGTASGQVGGSEGGEARHWPRRGLPATHCH